MISPLLVVHAIDDLWLAHDRPGRPADRGALAWPSLAPIPGGRLVGLAGS